MSKHILIISQYFYPETFRINDMACEWVKRGYKVTVLTGIPNYPIGKYFDGYDKKNRTRESWNNVNIIRIPLIARGNSSNKLLNAFGLVINYFSFIISGKKWVKSKEAAELHADLVFTFEVSPMTQALIGLWYGKRYHVPTYLYVQDLWPENVEAVTGIHNKLIIGPLNRMVDKIYRQTDIIFTTSPSFVNMIVNRKNPVDKSKVHYWPQYAEDFYKPINPQAMDSIDKLDCSYKIAFTGNIGTAQGLDILPKTAKILKKEPVKFIIVGEGRYQAELENQIDKLGVREKFIMIPRVTADKVPAILSNVDAGFISFNNNALWENTIPAKLQSYMACGKAIIASAAGETKRIITEADCGVCCEKGDPIALADGIKQMMNLDTKALGKNSRKYFEENFDKKKLMDEIDGYFCGDSFNPNKRPGKKILFLANHDMVIYNFRLEIIERFIYDGNTVHVCSPYGERIEDLKSLGAIYHEVNFRRHGMNPIEDLYLLKYYKNLMNSIKPDIVFTFTVKCNIYGGMASSSLNIPFIANITGLGIALNKKGFTNFIVHNLYKIGLKKAKKVFFQNEDNKNFMLNRKMITSPYTVLPGSGVNLKRFNYKSYPKDNGQIIISYIGRIMKDKGIDEFLEAATVIRKKYSFVEFRIIGFFDDDYEMKIKKSMSDGIVRYIPHQKDIRQWLEETHAVILPSYHEGMSNTLLEAAASGRPVIASNIPGCMEIFDEGISGIGFKSHNSVDMVHAIERFIFLPYEKKIDMGLAGRKKMEQEFNRDFVVQKYINELESI